MIATLGMTGRLFTFDAMHAQKKSTGPSARCRPCHHRARRPSRHRRFNYHRPIPPRPWRSVEVFPVGKALAETEWAPFINTIIRVTCRT
jgi:hypothetical protein